MPGELIPQRVCLLRLSALGDCANVVPVVHTLQAARPDIEITWVINRAEATLVADLPGVDCVVYDKTGGRAALIDLARRLRGRRFDVLLNMHASWRANVIACLVRADRRNGFDKRRARDGQRLFVSQTIAPVASRHVVDGFLAFAAAIGASAPVMDWRVPISAADRDTAATLLDSAEKSGPLLIISPCSSHGMRNWQATRYAGLADHAATHHGMRVVLAGGPSASEKAMGQAIIAAANCRITNLIGQTSLKQLLAVFEQGDVLVTPDSGPAHMANATDIVTISLHAATDPRRSGAYRSRAWCIDYFAEAAAAYRKRTPDDLKWGTRIEDDTGVMALIPLAAVTKRLDTVMAKRGA